MDFFWQKTFICYWQDESRVLLLLSFFISMRHQKTVYRPSLPLMPHQVRKDSALLHIIVVQLRTEKVSNHGSIAATIECTVLASIAFNEVRTNDSISPYIAHQRVSFSVCNSVSKKYFCLFSVCEKVFYLFLF